MYQDLTIPVGTFNLSFYMVKTASDDPANSIYISITNNTTNSILYSNEFEVSESINWRQYSATITNLNNSDYRFKIYTDSEGTALGIDNISLTKLESSVTDSTRKILCLHGGGESAQAFQQHAGILDMIRDLSGDFVFEFLDAPNSGLWWNNNAVDENGDKINSTDSTWGDNAINAINDKIDDDGPYYGILGYSQGAAAAIVWDSKNLTDSLNGNSNRSVEKLFLFNGYLPTTHDGLMNIINQSSSSTRTLIFIGENDTNFYSLGLNIKYKFINSVEVVDPNVDHSLPTDNKTKYNEVINFIKPRCAYNDFTSIQGYSFDPPRILSIDDYPGLSSGNDFIDFGLNLLQTGNYGKAILVKYKLATDTIAFQSEIKSIEFKTDYIIVNDDDGTLTSGIKDSLTSTRGAQVYYLPSELNSIPQSNLTNNALGFDFNTLIDYNNATTIYVKGGNFSSPYYNFYHTSSTDANSSISIEVFSLRSNVIYTFTSIGISNDHPFYIGDNGYENASNHVSLTGNGSATNGIVGSNQSIILQFKDSWSSKSHWVSQPSWITSPHVLQYYCTNHSNMISNFIVDSYITIAYEADSGSGGGIGGGMGGGSSGGSVTTGKIMMYLTGNYFTNKNLQSIQLDFNTNVSFNYELSDVNDGAGWLLSSTGTISSGSSNFSNTLNSTKSLNDVTSIELVTITNLSNPSSESIWNTNSTILQLVVVDDNSDTITLKYTNDSLLSIINIE